MPILLYHRVGPLLEGEDNMPPDKFEGHLTAIREKGMEIVSLPDYLQKDFNRREEAVAISFDDGMKNIYQYVFPLSLKYGFNFTVFLNSQFIGMTNWHSKASRLFYERKELAPPEERERLWFFEYLQGDEILAMKEKGMVFGSHGQSHRLLTILSRKDRREEICKSKITLEELLKEEVMYFSYPWGTFNRAVKREVKRSGYRFAFISNLSAREDAFSMGRLLVKKDWDGERLLDEIRKDY